MSTASVLKCDVCAAVIVPEVRHFTFAATLDAVNGDFHQIERERQDICSEQCLYASLRAMVSAVAITPKEESHGDS